MVPVKVFVSEVVKVFDPEPGIIRHCAVIFRNRLYVCSTHHSAKDAAFAHMTFMQMDRVCERISDGKETMLFGSAYGDGSGWIHDADNQSARVRMHITGL